MSSFTVRVPASSANLGPGFDALGLALGVYLTCRVRPAASLRIRAEGRDAAAIPTGPENLIWQTAVAVARLPRDGDAAHRVAHPQRNPHRQRHGSSAAALTAGVVIADRLLDLRWKPLRILDEAARLEGHPDNVAACTLGSIVASAIDSGGVTRAVRLDLPRRFGLGSWCRISTCPPRWRARCCPPPTAARMPSSTCSARRCWLRRWPPDQQRRFRRPSRIASTSPTGWRWCPGWTIFVKLRAPGLLGCALSGAGPSILVFYETRPRERVRPGAADLPPARARIRDAADGHRGAGVRSERRDLRVEWARFRRGDAETRSFKKVKT